MLLLVSACSSQMLTEGEAEDGEETWEAITADSCCVMIASERRMYEISVGRC